jgi:chromosome segregation ATPase
MQEMEELKETLASRSQEAIDAERLETELRDKIQSLGVQIQALQSTKDGLADELEQLTTGVISARSELAEIQSLVTNSEQQVQQLQRSIADLQDARQQAHDELSKATSDLGQAKEDLRKAEEELELLTNKQSELVVTEQRITPQIVVTQEAIPQEPLELDAWSLLEEIKQVEQTLRADLVNDSQRSNSGTMALAPGRQTDAPPTVKPRQDAWAEVFGNS